jgi:hypothetical protein
MQVQVGAMAHGKIDADYIDDLVAGIFLLTPFCLNCPLLRHVIVKICIHRVSQ